MRVTVQGVWFSRHLGLKIKAQHDDNEEALSKVAT